MCLVEKSMEAQELSGQEQDGLAGDGANGLGMSEGSQGEQPSESSESNEGNQSNANPHAQKRINARNRERERQMQYMQAKIADLEARIAQPNDMHDGQMTSPHDAGLSAQGDMAEHIHRAVNQVLAHKELQEQKVKQAQEAEHIHKQYQDLHQHLDNVADKYEDFDDVVRDPSNTSFTKHMRDASLLLPQTGAGSAGEVLYNLGKNKTELERISKLHPLEQARELNRLSHALASGARTESNSSARPMGNIKSNPVNSSHAINDKTTPSEIRARMKAGRFK